MKDFKREFKEMITNKFNINLYGPSGCGKTELVDSVIKDKQKDNNFIIVNFKLNDFFSKKNIFEITLNAIKKYSGDQGYMEKLNKWNDLYFYFKEFSKKNIEFLFIIDDILELEIFNYFKKEVLKLMMAVLAFPNLNILLISCFDMIKSELQDDFDFSSFIGMKFPYMTNDELIRKIKKSTQEISYKPNAYNEIINTCVANFRYPFININEYKYNIINNLRYFNDINSGKSNNEFFFDLIEKDNINSSNEMDIENEEAIINEIINDSEENSLNETDKKNIDKKDNLHRNIYFYNSSYKLDGEKFIGNLLRKNMMKQITFAPIHVETLESLFKNKNAENEENKKFKNNNENKNEEIEKIILRNTKKNFTDSLSKSQKFLLLASFLASETLIKDDHNLFQIGPNRDRKIRRGKKDTFYGVNLRTRPGNTFTSHRLISIYQSLLSIVDPKGFENDDLNVKSEIATLSSLGLLKIIKNSDCKNIDQKYMTGITFEFAQKIAEDYDIHLDDFIRYEKNI